MKFLRFLIATFHLNDKIVCEMSAGLGENDFHDYPDSVCPYPWHFYRHKCKRCSKEFII